MKKKKKGGGQEKCVAVGKKNSKSKIRRVEENKQTNK